MKKRIIEVDKVILWGVGFHLFTKKHGWRVSLIFIVLILLLGLAWPGVLRLAAQSGGDTLPTRTPTSGPLATPIPASSTPTSSPGSQTSSPTSSSIEAINWEGIILSETFGAAGPYARLLIRVVGQDNQPVRLSTVAQPINTANTGQKPDELGPNMVEFAGLTPGKYIIEPLGLNAILEVELKPYVETRVEFRPQLSTATPIPAATPTEIPRPLLPVATFTPPPLVPTATPLPLPTDTPTALPLPTQTPLPTPPSITWWLGVVETRTDTGSEPGSIAVRVEGIEGLPVWLYPIGNTIALERRCITGQAGVGQDICVFNNLEPGQYLVEPEGLRVKLPITLLEPEAVRLRFNLAVLPPGVAGWQAHIHKNTNNSQAKAATDSIITVKIAGQTGQVVGLRSAGGVTRFCEVVYNPVLGGLVCEFGQLAPGVYLVEALTTGASLRLFVDGAGEADIEFSPDATEATLAQTQLPPLVGQGARPSQPAPTPTGTPAPVPVVQTIPTATATPVKLPSPTPTLAFAWQGRVVESVFTGAGAIGVRAAGLKDHPVILRSGNWQSQPQLTGAKVELGQYAVEFGGLAQGEYIVELVDLAEFRVNLSAGEFILVEFRYDPVSQP
jgi:hypothetical protein